MSKLTKSFRFSSDLIEKLEKVAKEKNRKINNIAEIAIEEYCNRQCLIKLENNNKHILKVRHLRSFIKELGLMEVEENNYKFEKEEVYWRDGQDGEYMILIPEQLCKDDFEKEYFIIKQMYEYENFMFKIIEHLQEIGKANIINIDYNIDMLIEELNRRGYLTKLSECTDYLELIERRIKND